MDARNSRYEERYGDLDASTVDDKNRFTLSDEKKALLGPNFAFWIGKFGFLEAIPAEDLKIEIERVEAAGARNEAAQHIAMMLISNVRWNISVQANNRVPIPSALAHLMGFKKGTAVLVSSLGRSCVIAEASEWKAYQMDPTPRLKRFQFINEALKGVDEAFRPNFVEEFK
jgi:DNA-binding transcriptional regulator/RsmH inhibitor MraZ